MLPPRATQDMRAGRDFAVGDVVRHAETRGVERRVHGVQRTPDGSSVQFAAGGAWHPADAYAPAGADVLAAPSPTEDDPARPLPPT